MTQTTTALELDSEQTTKLHALYRRLHAHPELSMQEHATAQLIEEQLDSLGVEHFRCGGTGVVGIMRNGSGPVVAFRADTDGLPIEEATGLEYASTDKGTLDGAEVPVMHGCGHDTHVASLLGAAQILVGNRDAWAGTLVLIFQPGEETAAGALAMLDDGLWDRAPRPEVVFGQHVMPRPVGTVSISSGPVAAMADSLRVTVHGQQSHGSQPQDSIDPIVMAAHMVTRLQTIVSRELDPRKSAVVTVGTFHAGLKENIIPASAEFTLNIRTFDEDVRGQALGAVRRIIEAEAAASGAPTPQIEELYRFPQCFNDPDAVPSVLEALRGALGVESVEVTPPMMGSEDFGHLGTAIGVPSVFWMFGGTPASVFEGPGAVPVNHSPFFAPELEGSLAGGVSAAVAVLLSRLGN
ncbi:amidohydrolase [Paenarthrobacter nitroguajacolicus]|uniref:amidohydrolase n=1 Tax=Paenarthrobacter nitroguajacolicus TaxID=211146 RepID=UPI00248B9EA8|nr:amidohydrolase [Paenarthrobacter nitroguajacolicus]MDI2033199.1 Hippurate hydrolase [Paenarthrobacter nitroguajacolicus]